MGCCCGCTMDSVVQAVPGSTQYEPRSLTEQEKESLLNSEAVALFLEKVWPRFALAPTTHIRGWTSCTLYGYSSHPAQYRQYIQHVSSITSCYLQLSWDALFIAPFASNPSAGSCHAYPAVLQIFMSHCMCACSCHHVISIWAGKQSLLSWWKQ